MIEFRQKEFNVKTDALKLGLTAAKDLVKAVGAKNLNRTEKVLFRNKVPKTNALLDKTQQNLASNLTNKTAKLKTDLTNWRFNRKRGEIQQRVKMGYNSPEAIEKLRTIKLNKINSNLGQKTEKLKQSIVNFQNKPIKSIAVGTKDLAVGAAKDIYNTAARGVKYLYKDTDKAVRKGVATFAKDMGTASDAIMLAGGGRAAGTLATMPFGPGAVAAYNASPVGLGEAWMGARRLLFNQNKPVKHKFINSIGKESVKMVPKYKHKKMEVDKLYNKWNTNHKPWSIKRIFQPKTK